jgi:hypothetical protein
LLTDNGYPLRENMRGAGTIAAAAVLALLLVAGASAASAPTAITGPVTAFGATTATLSGTVNPNGDATTWHFDFGTTTGYGTSTTSTNAGSGTANSTVTANITGLAPGTTYHYRLVASSNSGTTQGADGVLTTAAVPAVETDAATNVTAASATLNGMVNPNGRPTGYWFEWGKTTGYGSKTPVTAAGSGTSPTPVSASISGLQTGQTYHFRLDATSDAGTSLGADVTLTASGSGPSAKTKAATSVTSTSATLNGTVNPSGQSTTWYFDYGTTTSYGLKTPVGTVAAGTKNVNVTASITGLTGGIVHFRLVASNGNGTSFGDDLTLGSAGPPVVQTGTAQAASTNGVTLTGSINPNGAAASWYFEYGPTSTYGTKTTAKSAGTSTSATGVSAAIASLTAGTTYHYRLVGSSSSGTAYGSDVTFTTISALTLTASTVQAVAGSAITLSGVVASRQTGVKVAVLGQSYGSSSFSTIGSALTGIGGSWTFQARPRVQTTFKASAPDGASTTVTVGVRPAVSLRVITGDRLTSRVVAAKPFTGKTVQLQRLLPGNRWKTVAKAKLNSNSSAVFSATSLPRGTSQIRVAMSVNQAGAGYLGAFSRTLTYKR